MNSIPVDSDLHNDIYVNLWTHYLFFLLMPTQVHSFQTYSHSNFVSPPTHSLHHTAQHTIYCFTYPHSSYTLISTHSIDTPHIDICTERDRHSSAHPSPHSTPTHLLYTTITPLQSTPTHSQLPSIPTSGTSKLPEGKVITAKGLSLYGQAQGRMEFTYVH